MGLTSCGVPANDFDAATSLVQLGPSAIPNIEQELRAMQKRGDPGLGASWIEIAYALIKGPAAFELFREMEQDPKFGSDQQGGDDTARRQLDRAIALSFNLTSFVSAPAASKTQSEPGPQSETGLLQIMCRASEPREALDYLIRDFERSDGFLSEAELGPEAKTALESLQKEKTWSQMRAELLRSKSAGDIAVGYRFEPSGRWSEPDASLIRNRFGHDTPEHAVLATQFTTRSGADCGSYRVNFELTSAPRRFPSQNAYLVNNSDLGGLLQVIAACLAKN
ncbi:MAG TPA: hypothetical protein VMH80_27085 [Bryobacteraceae bacterium]|nr:hypothetical protein [Bryobacteraceae bacterium]